MSNIPIYIVWDFWTDEDKCYGIYEKDEKLYYSEEKKVEPKLLEQKPKEEINWFKKLFKRKEK